MSEPSFAEIRVYEDIAELTDVRVARSTVRRNKACCKSLTEVLRKARMAGEGYFYLPANLWPPDTQRIELKKEWVVMSSGPKEIEP